MKTRTTVAPLAAVLVLAAMSIPFVVHARQSGRIDRAGLLTVFSVTEAEQSPNIRALPEVPPSIRLRADRVIK